MNPKRSKPKNDRTMPMIHPNAAAIDIGATMHMAAVRADRTPEPIRSFGTFTTDLHRLVDWFTECGVETVVMESTSVYCRCHRHVGAYTGKRTGRTSMSARRFLNCLAR